MLILSSQLSLPLNLLLQSYEKKLTRVITTFEPFKGTSRRSSKTTSSSSSGDVISSLLISSLPWLVDFDDSGEFSL